ncbi:hypothetical protein WKY82_10310 [Gordonia malaquae]|uniref:hypothetical protein n=1 Tax=Gordonia malaquae TaxID=410332 RepID=UPI0030C78E00
MKLWHPWRWLRDHHADVDVTHAPLCHGRMAELDGARIRMESRLTQAERRCSLTHELVHIERRGREHPDPDVEEQIVELESARRLITVDQLADAFRWLREPGLTDLAEHLWVDEPTAQCRMDHLDPLEVAQIEAACDGDWSWIRPDVGRSA